MYTLIGTLATRAFRVAWMLNELGEDFTLDPLSPRDPKLAAINPSLKVPVLKDGADIIIDSVAICQYLADKHGKFTYPAGTISRAHQDSFTQFAVDDIESTLWTTAKHTFVLPQELRVADVKTACHFDFDRAMTALSQRLGDNAFVMGETFTVPDLLIGHCAAWARRINWPIAEDNVKNYAARLHARPAFLKTVALREAQKQS
jgi:glutathione S-transferase